MTSCVDAISKCQITMADVHKLPDVNRVEREASEWIVRLNADDVSEEDRARFARWRAAHPLNVRAYDDLLATYQEFTSAGPFIRAVSFAQSMNEATTQRKRRRTPALAAAAVVAALAIGASAFVYQWPSTPTYKTAIGEHATISLPDGSTLELNSASSARVEYSGESRVIHLDRGEGFFKVAHDVRRPFWVVTPGSWVRAVGTAFNVYLRPYAVEVTVSEGVVKVGTSKSKSGAAPSAEEATGIPAAVVKAGQQAELQGELTSTRGLSTGELARAVAWREGILYFENRPLEEVVAELARYSSVQFIIGDEKVRRMLVGGTFQASPQGTEAFLATLEQGLGLRVRRDVNSIYIDSRAADHAH
jgi:transmembrane sensor